MTARPYPTMHSKAEPWNERISLHHRLPEFRPMDRRAVQPHTAFEVGAVIEIVLRRLLGDGLGAVQPGRSGQEFERRGEILFDVGPEMQRAVWLERPLDVANKYFVHHPPLLMPGLPPGIGKIDVHRRETRVRRASRAAA